MKRNLYILLTLFAVLLAGCEHKDFCCRCLQADDVEVVFDWSRSPDADPASMKVYFFPEGGGEALVYEFADIHGGSIRLPAGNYRAVCVNSDTEFLHYEHTDRFDSIRACTGGGVSGQLPGTDGEEFRNAPDRIWTDRLETFTTGHSPDQRRVIFRPAPSVCRYTVEIRNVSNLGYLGSTGSLRGSLTGLSDGLLLGTGEPSGHPVTLPFEATHDGKSTITADFLTFGPPAGATGKHLLRIYVQLPDGKKVYYTFDVTDQVRHAPDSRNVHIVLDGLTLPKPLANGSGFRPTVDDWQEVEVPLRM